MTTKRRRFDLSDAGILLGVALVTAALYGVDWRLAAGVLGLLVFAAGMMAELTRGGR